MKPLRAIKPAYDKYDQAIAAARKKDFARARSLTGEGHPVAAARGPLP